MEGQQIMAAMAEEGQRGGMVRLREGEGEAIQDTGRTSILFGCVLLAFFRFFAFREKSLQVNQQMNH